MLTSGVVLLHDSARSHTSTAARTRALLEHFSWELFDHPHYSPDLAQSDYDLFTSEELVAIRLQRFDNNEGLMEGVKTWLSSRAADFFHTGIHKLIPRYIPAVTASRSSLSIYVFFLYIIFFSHCLFY
jgi:histone-lysine N-methyltransferase SETMAR